MGCGSSKDVKQEDARDESTVKIVVGPPESPEPDSTTTSPAKGGKKPGGKAPAVRMTKAAEALAQRKKEEREAEEKRKRGPTPVKMSEGPAVRLTRAAELARDKLAASKEKEGRPRSPSKASLGPNGVVASNSLTISLSEVDVPVFEDKDFEGFDQGALLGKGAFGSAYSCTLRTKGACCVKVIELGAVAADPIEVAKLRDEIKLMKRMRHPHIVQYYGCTEDTKTNRIHIFMELITGGTLTKWMKQYQKVPRDLAKKWARQMVLGVKYLHDCGIVHRDIKGANILMTDDGTLKLADFGCSKSIDETCSKSRGCQTMVGTPYWMAPEVLKSQPYGAKADIWSVGCTIVEMITGKPPWPEMDNMWAAVYKIANSTGPPPQIPKDLPKNMMRFLERCFERNPTFRATADELLTHPWIADAG